MTYQYLDLPDVFEVTEYQIFNIMLHSFLGNASENNHFLKSEIKVYRYVNIQRVFRLANLNVFEIVEICIC